MKNKPKMLRVTTVSMSLRFLLKGQMQFMQSQGFLVDTASASGREVEEVKSYESVRHFAIPFTRQITPFADLKALWHLYRLIRKEKYDIVHSHTPKAGLIAMIAAWVARTPIRLHTVAGMPLMVARGMKRKVLERMERMTYRFATSVYPNSHGLMQFIQSDLKYKSDKLKVIGRGSSNGIDTTFFSPNSVSKAEAQTLRANFGVNDEDFVLIFIGRIVTDKGINELVRAFERLDPSMKVHLFLVGQREDELDPLDSSTLQAIKSNGNIHELGWRDDVRIPLLASNVLVFPSYREGFPNVPMQAGAMGLPSIVSDINGCNEIIVDGKNGIIVPVKHEEALFDALNDLLNDTEKINRMTAVARKMIVDRLGQSVLWEELLEEYKTQLACIEK